MMTLDAICTTAFGVDVNSCKDPDMELLKQARDITKKFNTGNILLMLCCKYVFFSQTFEESKMKSPGSQYICNFWEQELGVDSDIYH